jgi:predicted nucleotidyltransferase
MIDLRPQDRQLIEQLAREHLPSGSQLWLFGSRVKGTAHESSDVDMVVFPQNEQDAASVTLDFQQALQDSNLPLITQVFYWPQLPARFQRISSRPMKCWWRSGNEDNRRNDCTNPVSADGRSASAGCRD